MGGKVLLDTSVLVDLLRGDGAVEERLSASGEFFTSVVAVGELIYGAHRSGQHRRNRAAVDRLLADLTVLPCDRLTAEVYARLKDDLRRRGRPVPENDLWIAATAVQHGATLVSRDDHFAEIGELEHDRL